MKSLKKDIVVNAGFGLALAILIVIGYLYFLNVKAMNEFDQMVERSHAVILELEGLLSAMKDVENGEHLFIISGEETHLEPYLAAIGRIDRHLATLKRLTNNHPAQQNRVDRVEPLIREKLAETGKTIDVRKREGYRAAYQREFTDQHERHMVEIRRQVTLTQEAVGQHLNKRKASKKLSTRNMILTFITGTALSFALLSTIFLLLIKDIAKRKRAEKEIERLNASLAARAADLEYANRELESFNYTVAHDLRKPLTVVNGYCQAIKELCFDKLDDECKGYLREAYDGTWRMNRLIDALINFSRLTHVDLRRETVDFSAMAHVAAAKLQLNEPARRVEIRITDGIVVDGDANLLRVVLDNLLGNAWKYTATREEGIIEFGMTEVDGKQACFVRDNGTGFNMADADKLFVPFQRLPGAEEFRGFGIGLASVERIIRRHGGRVWAEGYPGKVATFYFTLPA